MPNLNDWLTDFKALVKRPGKFLRSKNTAHLCIIKIKNTSKFSKQKKTQNPVAADTKPHYQKNTCSYRVLFKTKTHTLTSCLKFSCFLSFFLASLLPSMFDKMLVTLVSKQKISVPYAFSFTAACRHLTSFIFRPGFYHGVF